MLLAAYVRELEAHGWVRVPSTHNRTTFFTHGMHLLDRIQVAGGRWSHQRFDGASWVTHSTDDDPASLDTYLAKHFPSVSPRVHS